MVALHVKFSENQIYFTHNFTVVKQLVHFLFAVKFSSNFLQDLNIYNFY